MVYII